MLAWHNLEPTAPASEWFTIDMRLVANFMVTEMAHLPLRFQALAELIRSVQRPGPNLWLLPPGAGAVTFKTASRLRGRGTAVCVLQLRRGGRARGELRAAR